jgi:hypothetical protein
LPGPIRVTLLAAGCVTHWSRRRRSFAEFVSGFRPDWALLAILAASLCATARYQRPFDVDGKRGGLIYILDGDQTYFAALVQELQRSDPPATCAIRAGVPERPYHHLPHLTVALLATEGHAPDVVRLHLVVGYSVLVCLTCALTFVLTRELSGSRTTGLLGAFMMFVGAIPMPSLLKDPFKFFYFTIWPQASSTIEPVLFTSPQMFWGLALALAVLLGLLRLVRSTAASRPCTMLALTTAVMTALLMRFRIHCFIVLAPLAALLLTWLMIRHRRWSLLAALALLGAISAAEFLEMHLPGYLAGGQSLRIGNNRLAMRIGFVNGWPGAEFVANSVVARLPAGVAEWAWQFLSISAFSGLNIVGIPLAICAGCQCRSAWRNVGDRPIVWIAAGIVGLTVVGAATLASGYDPNSVGMQLPFHLGWYLLPFGAAGLAPLGNRIGVRFPVSRTCWSAAGLALLAVTALVQLHRGPSPSESAVRQAGFRLSADEVDALNFIRNRLPREAVLFPTYFRPKVALWSGFGARRSYLDYLPNAELLDWLIPESERARTRLKTLHSALETNDDSALAKILRDSPATHLVERAERSLHIHPPGTLRLIWTSPSRQFLIWEIIR